MIFHKYAKANILNTANYKKGKTSQFIMYWNTNNLSKWAKSQYYTRGSNGLTLKILSLKKF